VPEELGVPGGRLARLVPAVLHEVLRDLSGEAGAADDQPLAVAGEHLAVDARLEVEALRVADGGELRQVPVPLVVAREEDQVVVALLPLLPAAVEAAAGGDVRLHPDDRLDPGLAGLLLEDPGAEHHAVVGEGEGRLLELLGTRDEVADAVGAVEQRVLRVAVQVDERHRPRGSESEWGEVARSRRPPSGWRPDRPAGRRSGAFRISG